jgi:hypothetical protein
MSDSDQNPTPAVLDTEAEAFVRDLVIAKTGIDYDKLSKEDQVKLGFEIFDNYVTFIDTAVKEVGDVDEQKHWGMYKASGLNPKLLETLPTLAKTISELTEAYLEI